MASDSHRVRAVRVRFDQMSPAPVAILNLARQLIAGEPARADSPYGEVGQAVRACEKLRVPLTKLAGAAGYASLLSRALVLARRQAPSLSGLRVQADGSLTGWEEDVQVSAPAETAPHGGAVLLAEMLGLLAAFIGEPLMLSLVREAWPDAPVAKLSQSPEEKT